MSMKLLVTGGLGYIGSHTVKALYDHHHTAVIVDDLSNAKESVHHTLETLVNDTIPFYQADAKDIDAMRALFEHYHFDGVLHFAGHKAVGESVSRPMMYYHNNLNSTLTLAQLCVEHRVSKFIFSSSATVYGDQPSPLHEGLELKKTTNPYGETKAISERMLTDIQRAHPSLSVALLRYFNPIGADESGLLGEDPQGIPNNLMPFITNVASQRIPQLNVYGDDYETPDGTGVRDYIHVSDLARGHVLALEKITEGVHIYNLGTGQGTSVFQMIEAFERVNQVSVPYRVVPRRPGDVAITYAAVEHARDQLGFQTEKSIDDMVKDSWRFTCNQKGTPSS